MKNKGKKEIKRILFYTGIPRNFRSTSIGYLYEISQVYPIVLLSEELDEKLKRIIGNRKLFPKIEKIITVNQYTGSNKNLFQKNHHFYKMAKETIDLYKPDIVVTPHDIYPFEMYLLRFAKKINAVTLAVQEGNSTDIESNRKYVDLINAYLRFPRFLPLFIRFFLVQLRKYSGHILYYWILPILVFQEPFFGKSSYILRKGISGMRDADYRIVFSKRDYDFHIKAGVPSKKLYILSHPLKRNTKNFFEEILLNNKNNYKISDDKIATLLIPAAEIGFKKENHSFISEKERMKNNIETINLISKTLKDWKFYIKPHPLVKSFNEMKKNFESISNSIKVINPLEPIEEYIKMGKAIIELPISMSTSLFSTSLLFPEKAILSLDLNKELAGDFYKNFKGIEYISSKEKLIKVLELIKNNKFHKKNKLKNKKIQKEKFSSLVDLLNFLTIEKNDNHFQHSPSF